MGKCVDILGDYDAAWFRDQARRSKDAKQARRLLSLAAIRDGKSRREAAEIGGMDRQTLRDWVHRFNAQGVDGLLDRKAPGARFLLSPEQGDKIIDLLSRDPVPEEDGTVRWRLVDLCDYAQRSFGVKISIQAMSEFLNRRRHCLLTVRPRAHNQDPEAIEAFKKRPIQRRWQPSKPRSAKI